MNSFDFVIIQSEYTYMFSIYSHIEHNLEMNGPIQSNC